MTPISRTGSNSQTTGVSISPFGPNSREEVLSKFKGRLRKEAIKPQTLRDLTFFAFDIRRLISDNRNAIWLLMIPVDSTQKSYYQASVQCASIIKDEMSPCVFGQYTWPETTYDLLDMMERLGPEPWDQCNGSLEFPQRRKVETMSQYFMRAERWVACYMPEAVTHPGVVRRLATLVWAAHCELYDLDKSNLAVRFATERAKFETLHDVRTWFEEQAALRPALLDSEPEKHSNDADARDDSDYGSLSSSEEEEVSDGIESASHKDDPPSTLDQDAENVTHGTDPKSYKEAMRLPDATQWKQACDAEMRMIKSRGVLELVNKPKKAHVLPSGWILERISDGGALVEHKAHLIARGNVQRRGKDYDETYAEVVSADVLRLMFALAAQHDWHIEQVRVESAFCYGELEHILYMKQPEGYEDGTGRVYRLKKSIDGLKQAPRQWFMKLANVLASFHFLKVKDTTGLFVRTVNQRKTYVVVYVDDMLVFSEDKAEAARVISLIGSAFDITTLGFPKSYLSLRIERRSSELTLDAQNHISKLLDEYRSAFSRHAFMIMSPIMEEDAEKAVRIANCQEKHLPVDPDCEADAEPLSPEQASRFRSAVGRLTNPVSQCRPDVAFTASQLSQYASNPNKRHWIALMYVLNYLDCTDLSRLKFVKQSDPQLVGYSDATFSGKYVKHPHGGYIWTYGGSVINWSSCRERGACVNAYETSMRSLTKALEYGQWLRNLLVSLGELDASARNVLYANVQPFSDAQNKVVNKDKGAAQRMSSYRGKVQKHTNGANITVQQCNRKNQLAGILTKVLPWEQFCKFVPLVGVPLVEVDIPLY